MIRLAVLDQVVQELQILFSETAPREQGAFCLMHEGRGESGLRLVATKTLLPTADAWELQGKGTLRPRAQWISAAIGCAVQNRAGLLFVHSHPDPLFPIGLSSLDLDSFRELAKHLAPTMDGHFGAAVVHPHGWGAVVWHEGNIVPVDRVVGVGANLRFLSPLPPVGATDLDDRQKNALGVVHDRIRNLTVAVAGSGGTGSPTGEQLVRMGVEELILVDKGRLDTPSNVRRVFGSRPADFQSKDPRPKVDVVGDHLDGLQLGTRVNRVYGDVRSERVFRRLLDADVVISATDDHGSRAILNELATTYCLPVIDVGVRAGSKVYDVLCALVAEVRILTPTTACLWCRGTIDANVIREENLPEKEREQLQREGYLRGSRVAPAPTVVALTVLGSSLATCALLRLISEEGEIAPSGFWVDGFFGDSRETKPKLPIAGCRCRRQLGLGDSAPPPFLFA